jgi:hypothetical protein
MNDSEQKPRADWKHVRKNYRALPNTKEGKEITIKASQLPVGPHFDWFTRIARPSHAESDLPNDISMEESLGIAEYEEEPDVDWSD